MKRRRFKHLTWNDRLRIESFLKCKQSVQEIADEIGGHRNTIYNEIKRGLAIQRTTDPIDREIYCADVAERKYRQNLSAKGSGLKIGKDHRLAEYIERRIIEYGYSPAAAPREIKVKGIQFHTSICEATLVFLYQEGRVPAPGSRSPSLQGQEEAVP